MCTDTATAQNLPKHHFHVASAACPVSSTRHPPAAGCDTPQSVWSPQHPSMASTSQPQPGNPAEAKLIYQPKFGQGFRAHLRDSKYWPVDLMLLSHHNPMASGHILSLSPSHSVPVAAPVTWGLQSRPAKLEPGGEGGSIQRENEPGPSITIQQWG